MAMANMAFAQLQNNYVKTEMVDGCGATGQPIWTETVTDFYYSNGKYLIYPISMYEVDSLRLRVKCVNCTLYANGRDNWWFWDPDADAWDASIDLGGYQKTVGSTSFYRGEEKYELCNDYYGWYENIMRFTWGYTSPGTQNTWTYYVAPYII
jgi:hypothetical protein